MTKSPHLFYTQVGFELTAVDWQINFYTEQPELLSLHIACIGGKGVRFVSERSWVRAPTASFQ